MSPRRLRVLLATCLMAASSCDADRHPDEAEPHEHEPADPGHDPARPGEATSGGNTVRIERGMLRDLRVTTQAAESRPAGDSVIVLGELQINEDAYAEVGAPIPARVSGVLAAPGDLVRVGQALAELSSPEVGQARAALRSAEARRELARRAVERKNMLSGDRIVSERDVEAARADLIQTEAEALAARQGLAALGASGGDGARFLLRTPIAGTVIERNALLGRQIDAARPAFIVGDLARLWLVVHAFERDALRMRTGTRARVMFPALPGEPSGGAITHIGSRVDRASRTVDVRVEMENPTGVLRPGMSASALIPLGDSKQTVVAVPVEALQRSPEGWCVFLPKEEEGAFELRAVGRGRDLGGEVEVLSGLRAGERVVKDGAFLLKAEADKARGGGEGEHHH
jgi:cobalt-zinc-cadmium efflux system membrane fusion protein